MLFLLGRGLLFPPFLCMHLLFCLQFLLFIFSFFHERARACCRRLKLVATRQSRRSSQWPWRSFGSAAGFWEMLAALPSLCKLFFFVLHRKCWVSRAAALLITQTGGVYVRMYVVSHPGHPPATLDEPPVFFRMIRRGINNKPSVPSLVSEWNTRIHPTGRSHPHRAWGLGKPQQAQA